MKLAASLLALVAAAPALVSAAPWRDCVHHSATPGPAGGGDGVGRWRNFIARALEDHINLATQTLSFIARNFDNPPGFDNPPSLEGHDDKVEASAILSLPGHTEIFIRDDDDIDFVRLRNLLESEGLSPDDIDDLTVRPGLIDFKMENFVRVDEGLIHVLSERNPHHAQRLWEFFYDVGAFLNPELAEQSLPPVFDIFGAEITDGAVRELLASVADVLSQAAREDFDDLDFWVDRLESLDKAISKIHLFDDDPLTYHGIELANLLRYLDSSSEDERRNNRVRIAGAASAVKAVCSIED